MLVNQIATWLGYGLMIAAAVALLCGLCWCVTELVWRQIQRVQGVAYVLSILRQRRLDPDGVPAVPGQTFSQQAPSQPTPAPLEAQT